MARHREYVLATRANLKSAYVRDRPWCMGARILGIDLEASLPPSSPSELEKLELVAANKLFIPSSSSTDWAVWLSLHLRGFGTC